MYPFPLLNDPPAPTYPEYAAVVARARQIMPAFVDPANLWPERPVRRRRGDDWCTAVLGRPLGLGTRLTRHEQYLLIAADEADIDPPLPSWIVEGREAGRAYQAHRDQARANVRQRDLDAWSAVAEQVTVELDVHANTTARTRHGYAQHLGHAVPRADVYSGVRKVRTHPRGRALCESPTRARPLALYDEPESAGTPVTCDRCLTWAPKVRAAP